MRRISIRSAAILVALTVLIYVADYLFWRHRLATGRNACQTLTVQYYYAVGEKNGKTEYDFQPPQPEVCVNALFPHAGLKPCWYERKHTEKAITI